MNMPMTRTHAYKVLVAAGAAPHDASMLLAGSPELRDEFAGKALQGFCANPAVFAENGRSGWGLVNAQGSDLAHYCFSLADDMLAERAK